MNTVATVTNLDDERLIREGETAASAYAKSGRESILPMALGLVAARRKYRSDQEFGRWFDQSSYPQVVTNHTMRAALIYIGEHDDVAKPIVQNCRTVDPEAIAATIKGVLQSVSENLKPPPAPPSPPQLPPQSAPVAKIGDPQKNNPTSTPYTRITQRSGFYDAPRAQEIAAMFRRKEARVGLSNIWQGRGGKQIWELIVTALDAGLITSNDRTIDKPNLGLLFPSAPIGAARQFDLSNQKERARVRDIVLPSMIACRDKLLAGPDRMREILAEQENENRTKQRQAVVAEKHSVAVKTMPSAEQELVMFGHPVWPRLDNSQGEYDYDQVRAAIWTFRDYQSWNVMANENVESFALRVRNSQRYLGEYVLRTGRDNPLARVYSLIQWFSRLMELSPQGECKWPMYPHIEGQW